MKIAYVCHWNAYAHDGVATKINTQTAMWREAGHQVQVFCLSPAPEPGSEPYLGGRAFCFSTLRERVWATAKMLRVARGSKPDAVYLRWDSFLPTPGRLMRDLPTVIEVNGSAFELRDRSALVRLYWRMNRHIGERTARGFVAVSYSVGRLMEPSGKPVEVVANGVDLDAREPLVAPATTRPRFVLLAGARAVPWHGVDKILHLAAALPECDFTLIGVAPEQLDAAPSANVTVHGLLRRSEYEPLLAESDVAIGSMAMERAGLDEASTLKFPEYLAYGLPVILGYEEAHFANRPPPWYLLRLPTAPDNVATHVAEIRAFAEGVKGRRVQRDEIAGIVGIRAREAQRLKFIAAVTGQPATTQPDDVNVAGAARPS